MIKTIFNRILTNSTPLHNHTPAASGVSLLAKQQLNIFGNNTNFGSDMQMVSLTQNNKFFKSRRKDSRKKKIKFFQSNPHLFQRVTKMRFPDIRGNNVIFPIKVPLKVRYVYKPMKQPKKVQSHDAISFKYMTGNEILINLENADQLSQRELTLALLELGKREGAENIDWNQHEYVINVVNIVKKGLPGYQTNVVSGLCLAFQRLRITDEFLWIALEREANKLAHNMTPQGFAYTYSAFIEQQSFGTQEFKQRLLKLLPIHLSKMSANLVVQCFQLCLKYNLIDKDSHVFENHFHVLFWRKVQYFGPSNLPKIIKGLLDIKYLDDVEFWSQEFLPKIYDMKKQLNEQNIPELVASLEELEKAIPALQTDCQQLIKFVKGELLFMESRLKAVESVKFYNMVQNDLKYFYEKQKRILQGTASVAN